MALSIRAKTYGLSGVVCLFLVGSGLLSTQTLGELANDAELRDRARLQESTLYEINLLLAREVAGESARPALLEKLHRFEVASAELRDLIGPSTKEASTIHTAFDQSGQSWAAYAGGVADTLEQLDSRVASFEAVTRGLSPLLAKLSSVERAFKKADEDEYEYHIETAQDARAGFGELRNTLYKLVALPFGDELNQTDLAVRLTCERHLEEALALLNGSDDLELEPVEDDALIPQLQAMHKLATDMGGNVITLVEAKLALERERDALGAKLDGTALSLREVGAAAADSSRASQAQFHTMLAGIAFTSALLLAFLLKISRGVLAGLQRANTVADGITSGDLNQEIPLTREDEIGHLFLAMNGMQDGLRGSKQQADRAREVEAQRSLDLEKLHQQQVVQAGELQESLADSRALAEKDAKRSQMESERAAELGGLANSSLTAAVEGSTIVESAVASMAKINESSNLIAAIVSTIDDIAFQTNLLALNASVEAERAGDAGRGFAVVAGEVSSLATRSAQSAKQISELIEESILRVEIGSKQVNASGNNLNAIVASVREVSLFIEELAKTP